jgi:hypothetical protein
LAVTLLAEEVVEAEALGPEVPMPGGVVVVDSVAEAAVVVVTEVVVDPLSVEEVMALEVVVEVVSLLPLRAVPPGGRRCVALAARQSAT